MAERLEILTNRHRALVEQWEQARRSIEEVTKKLEERTGSKLPEHIERGEAQEVRFGLFGATCYARFAHNLDHGFVEYGTLTKVDGRERRKPVEPRVEFDRSGSVVDGEGRVGEHHVHWRAILDMAPRLVAKFYGLDPEGAA